jgi:hypothetical protein
MKRLQARVEALCAQTAGPQRDSCKALMAAPAAAAKG